MKTTEIISTSALLRKLADTSVSIIDSRPVDAYNGWNLEGEKRGGHIPGARNLPFKWTQYLDWIEIVRNKEIFPEQEIIIYGYRDHEIEQLAAMFHRAGYHKLYRYPDFVDQWVNDHSLPLEKLARFKHLVPGSWLQQQINNEASENKAFKDMVICHCHYRNPEDYKRGHIPGAIPLNTNKLESEKTWNRRSPQELKTALLEHGINSDTTVVVYGKFSYPKNEDPFPGSSAGHLGAIRCAAIMLYAGVKDVRILNGGMQSWRDEGYPVISQETKPSAVKEFGSDIHDSPEVFIDTPEAKQYIADPNSNLVSIRSWPEYIGELSGYNYIEKTGRIPGSVFGNCGTDAYHMENYRNLDHTMREYQETEKLWAEMGITPDKRNAFYCGTGWRGSEAFMNAWLMGWPDIAVYDGGWFEWSNDPENPVAKGEPER